MSPASKGCHYYGYDGLGSTRLLTDAGGAVAASYRYDAWGELLDSSGEVDNPYTFAGEQFDEELDQYYLRARYYDQGVGRFTSMDTWVGRNSDPITLHKYIYANADPVKYVDPTGHFGISEMSVTMNIVGTLTTMQIDNAFSVFDQFGIDDPDIQIARQINQAAGIFMLGSAGVQIVEMLSRKIASKCAGKPDTCVKAVMGKINTPHGVAQQLDSPEAWAALSKAQSGAPLYRVGKFGRSNTGDAQFGSLEDPRKMDPEKFASAFGIPKANANFEFLMIGRLKPGQMAITRSAPGVGGNVGGSMEVVVNPNAVALEVFHTF